MEKVRLFLSKWGMVIAVPLILIGTTKSCSTSRTVDSLEKENIEIKEDIKEIKEISFTKKEMKDEMQRTMLDFLIYEDELDKRKISISQIKEKIELDDNATK